MTRDDVLILEKGKRKVLISLMEDGRYYIVFKYDGYFDREWKRGAHGMFCDICDTLPQAKAKGKRYINQN